ncbi:hypothetical protein [Desulfosporosinus sp. HMP52]|uniref:hypothetical protein n=1 Tax=Desulfosporosinus sp. HMP52 TaxID=1487923 RepID=UPI0009DE2622|nr:hypothetical protein [Desulfosporosinus sp. HMP52]
MVIDKQKAALSSVFAAVFLTLMKTVVGIFTGSLGILSEALHSILSDHFISFGCVDCPYTIIHIKGC